MNKNLTFRRNLISSSKIAVFSFKHLNHSRMKHKIRIELFRLMKDIQVRYKPDNAGIVAKIQARPGFLLGSKCMKGM